MRSRPPTNPRYVDEAIMVQHSASPSPNHLSWPQEQEYSAEVSKTWPGAARTPGDSIVWISKCFLFSGAKVWAACHVALANWYNWFLPSHTAGGWANWDALLPLKLPVKPACLPLPASGDSRCPWVVATWLPALPPFFRFSMTIFLPCLHMAFSSLCVLVSKFPFSSKDTYLWIRTHPNDFILTWFHLGIPCFQIKSHSQYCGLGLGRERGWRGMIQPKPLSERLGAEWGKPAVRTAEVYDFRSWGGERDEAMLPFKASRRMHKPTTRKPAGELSPHIWWCQERTTNSCSQVRGHPPPSLPTSLPAAGPACRRWEKCTKQRPCPRSERSGHSPTPHGGPLSHRKSHSRGKGVIRRTGPRMSWIRLNERLCKTWVDIQSWDLPKKWSRSGERSLGKHVLLLCLKAGLLPFYLFSFLFTSDNCDDDEKNHSVYQ